MQGLPADASRAAGRSCPRDSSPAAGRSSGCIARSCCRPPIGSRAGRAREGGGGRPDQPVLWRMNPRRMDIEAYRDSLLQASGKLDLTLYGPSRRTSTTAIAAHGVCAISRGRSSADVMKLYDVPAPMAHIPMRQPTINPLQALFVMNSGFVQEQAAGAGRAGGRRRPRPRRRFRRSIGKVFARDASRGRDGARREVPAPAPTLARYAQALLSTNEVIFWP